MSMTTTKNHRIVILSGLFATVAFVYLFATSAVVGSELVANSTAIAAWRPWEITHMRTRTVYEETGWNSWGGAYYRFGQVCSSSSDANYNFGRPGVLVGADYGTNRYWQLGGTVGYAVPQIDNSDGKITADDITLGVYSKINCFDQAMLSTFLGYGYQHYKYSGNTYDGDAGYASIEFTKFIAVSPTSAILPLLAFDHQTAWTKKIASEGLSGASLGRTMVRAGVDSTWSAMDIDLVGMCDVATRAHLGLLVDGDRRSKVTTFPATGATIRGADLGWWQANVGMTLSGEYQVRYRWFLDLDGFAAMKTFSAQAQFGISTRW